MTGGGFWAYRHEEEGLGKANGLQPFPTKAVYATAQGIGAGVVYGIMHWAYYPDKFVFGHKNSVTSGPSRGFQYLQATMIRPAVAFSAVGVTFAAVESFMEEAKGSHSKDPWNSVWAGAAAGLVMGKFFTKRFDYAGMAALATGILMGAVEFNGPNLVTDPVTEQAKKFPATLPTQFEETSDLSGLKDKYPAYKQL
eukprot:Nitzschia sp. Nitz4//scaffold23_size168460//128307//129013//NITZ4_002241-RA/size168460-snap-gene-0.167-mRNA-1//-1//CDS//3329543701//2104//frame0